MSHSQPQYIQPEYTERTRRKKCCACCAISAVIIGVGVAIALIWLRIGKRKANIQGGDGNEVRFGTKVDESGKKVGNAGGKGDNSTSDSTGYGKVNKEGCGLHAMKSSTYRNSSSSQIIKVESNTYPWIIRIHYEGTFKCVGVLVTDQWILTSSSCVTNRGTWTAYIGGKVANLTTIKHSNRQVDEYGKHLVLVKIKEKIKDTNLHRPICLDVEAHGVQHINFFYRYANWTYEGGYNSNQIFFETDLRSTSFVDFKCNYQNDPYKNDATYATSDNRLTMKYMSYSGAPLMECESKKNGKCTLIGSLTSYITNSNTNEFIAHFANVRGNLEWIKDTVGSEK